MSHRQGACRAPASKESGCNGRHGHHPAHCTRLFLNTHLGETGSQCRISRAIEESAQQRRIQSLARRYQHDSRFQNAKKLVEEAGTQRKCDGQGRWESTRWNGLLKWLLLPPAGERQASLIQVPPSGHMIQLSGSPSLSRSTQGMCEWNKHHRNQPSSP